MSDLIKRVDAIRAIHREARIAGGSVAIEYADMFQDVIEALPSADRPQGEWIMSKPEEEGFGAVFQCSRCSCEVDCVPTNFCPNCGARMKGADDDINNV